MPTPTRREYVTIDGTPLPCPAWDVLNLSATFLEGPATRGQDRLLPGAAGVVPYPRRVTVSPRTLYIVIWGNIDVNGVAQSDPRIGLATNVTYFRSHISDPTGTGDGTRTAVYHLADGSTRSGKIHVEDFQLNPSSSSLGAGAYNVTMDITIPGGSLV